VTKTKKKKRRPLRAIFLTLITLILIGLTCTAICGTAFAYYIREYVSKDIDIDLEDFSLYCTNCIYYWDQNGNEVEMEE